MSSALFIVAEKETPGRSVDVNGKALGRAKDLDALAKKAGVPPLMAFFSQDPGEAAALFEDAGMDPPAAGFPPERWFSAQEGLTSVRALISELKAEPLPSAAAVLQDLQEFERVLTELAATGVRWHLGVDY